MHHGWSCVVNPANAGPATSSSVALTLSLQCACGRLQKRAEELKKQIQDGPAKKPVVAHDGAAGKDSGSGGAEDKVRV